MQLGVVGNLLRGLVFWIDTNCLDNPGLYQMRRARIGSLVLYALVLHKWSRECPNYVQQWPFVVIGVVSIGLFAQSCA